MPAKRVWMFGFICLLALAGLAYWRQSRVDPQVEQASREITRVRGIIYYFHNSNRIMTVSLSNSAATDDTVHMITKAFPDLRSIDLTDTSISDAALIELKPLPLEELRLMHTAISDNGTESLLGLRNTLGRLDLTGTRITDVGLSRVAQLTELVELSLAYTAVTDKGIRALSTLVKMHRFDLGGTVVSDTGLSILGSMSKLYDLRLVNTGITDHGLQEVAKCKDLHELDLAGCTNITDRGLEHIGLLSQLTRLRLGGRHITDAGLDNLAGLPYLDDLDLGDSPLVTKRGVARFKEAHPNARLSWRKTRE